MTSPPVAVAALDVPLRLKASNYPEPFASLMAGRVKRQLGEVFGLTNFGVNLVRLESGSRSALRHAHSRQDEFVYVLAGEAVLVTDRGETVLGAGMCAGFRAGSGDAHYLLNRGAGDALYLEVGDRTPGDEVSYPDDDIEARLGADGRWQFVRKNGEPY
jgi:uncharacterized cupin superfamily protein